MTVNPTQSEVYPCTCSAGDLALNDGTTFETHERLSTDPDSRTSTT